MATIDLSDPESLGFEIQGHRKRDSAGISVSYAGDVNGDGIADLVLGAIGMDTGRRNEGAGYVIFGKAGGLSRIDLSHLSPADGVTIHGDDKKDALGLSVSAGDFNGDGFADLLLGAPGHNGNSEQSGAAYVIYGKGPGSQDLDLSSLRPADGFSILGEGTGDQAGRCVAAAGDFNGDG